MRFYKKKYCDTSSKLFELLPKPINHQHYTILDMLGTFRFLNHTLNDLVIVVYLTA
jgi:hypothetical protein